MRLVFLIKTYLTLAFAFGLTTTLLAKTGSKNDSIKYKVESKYKTEASPYFQFNTFHRGETANVLKSRLDSLSQKDKLIWNRYDSLSFAKTNLLAGNTELAEHYFSHLKIDPEKNYNDNLHDLCAIYVAKKFDKGQNKIKKNYPRIIQLSEIYFFKQLFICQDSIKNNSNWYKEHPTVFNFYIDSNTVYLKDNIRFFNEVIEPIQNATTILELVVFYIHEEDPIIARAFNDIGVVLESHVSLSQAYIAYSIGRNYNKRDKEILENIKRVKAKLQKSNYKIPNFRKYFPRIESWRFDYEILKEKIISQKNDTIPRHEPILVKEQTTQKLPFPAELLIPLGLFIIFLLILIFVRTRRR